MIPPAHHPLAAAGGGQLLPVTPALGAACAVLLAVAALVAGRGGLGHGRAVLRAGLRAAVQLALVALVIAWVVRSLWTSALFVLLMFTVAVRTAGKRIGEGRRRGGGGAGAGRLRVGAGRRRGGAEEGEEGAAGRWEWVWAAVPIAAGVLPVLLLLAATGLLPAKGITVIPVAGILIGGALTATSLAGRRALDELRLRHGEVEAALALGFEERDARLEICRTAAATSLVPALDQTRTVGLVTLPGAFVGMLLGGATPVQAGAVQLFVLVALLAVEAVAVTAVLELVGRGLVGTASGIR
ncbi:ABC transporter permease [Kitasatospora sp. YST-16]|uniref:ABC transporter permease n=1 Tax=Kitasatospora sp. YST-16 TaxID=2998080 RepID=UPI002284C224|nr:ABC transporter permease [Kitasatospora sp. YST-16]WAL71625.1 ABC transporter permease [Kitasatospora sp. YST-16]WNW37663.1 ABC transporter permease [Streptomyces sp. Li-HN-5-13]